MKGCASINRNALTGLLCWFLGMSLSVLDSAILIGGILKNYLVAILSGLLFSFSAIALADADESQVKETYELVWEPGTDIEAFWLQYTTLKGGVTWGRASEYPEYEKVNEGDTFLVQLEQGACLMEFFHSRWRRANDVRRWGEAMNSYGGCPYVFD